MPSKYPSTAIWAEMADHIGCDIATIKAVFQVEASGKFYNSDGSLPRRFEPHHFPREHWAEIGFNPGKQAPWRASLKVSTSRRRDMFDKAENINAEATYDASSWGAPQIMGFNAESAGYGSSTEMIDAFEQSADEQIRAFVGFCVSNDLDTHLRSQNWHSFAAGYNGSGQAAVYARKIEAAYRSQSGGKPSSPVLRLGSRGQAVASMQANLAELGYSVVVDGSFGSATKRAVEAFQGANGLKVDGVAGAATLRVLSSNTQEGIEVPKNERVETPRQHLMSEVTKQIPTVLGSGGVTGVVASLNDNSQTIIVGGLVLGVIAIAAIWLLRKG